MGKVKGLLYLSSFLAISIPIAIVIMSEDVAFHPSVSNMFIISSIVLLLLGKSITVYEKRIMNVPIAADIGLMIGISIVLITRLI